MLMKLLWSDPSDGWDSVSTANPPLMYSLYSSTATHNKSLAVILSIHHMIGWQDSLMGHLTSQGGQLWPVARKPHSRSRTPR